VAERLWLLFSRTLLELPLAGCLLSSAWQIGERSTQHLCFQKSGLGETVGPRPPLAVVPGDV